jgi:hypothetical protein
MALLMMTMPDVIRCRCPVRRPILTACHRQERLQWTRQRKTGVISSGGISSQIKVDFAFTTQMAKQGSDECVMNSMLIHASWEKTLGGPNIMVCNGIGIKDQFPRPQGCYFCTSSKLHSSCRGYMPQEYNPKPSIRMHQIQLLLSALVGLHYIDFESHFPYVQSNICQG